MKDPDEILLTTYLNNHFYSNMIHFSFFVNSSMMYSQESTICSKSCCILFLMSIRCILVIWTSLFKCRLLQPSSQKYVLHSFGKKMTLKSKAQKELGPVVQCCVWNKMLFNLKATKQNPKCFCLMSGEKVPARVTYVSRCAHTLNQSRHFLICQIPPPLCPLVSSPWRGGVQSYGLGSWKPRHI